MKESTLKKEKKGESNPFMQTEQSCAKCLLEQATLEGKRTQMYTREQKVMRWKKHKLKKWMIDTIQMWRSTTQGHAVHYVQNWAILQQTYGLVLTHNLVKKIVLFNDLDDNFVAACVVHSSAESYEGNVCSGTQRSSFSCFNTSGWTSVASTMLRPTSLEPSLDSASF